MRIRTLTIAAASVLALGAAACTQAEQEKAETQAEAAGDKAADVAAQTGEVVESGAMKAAQAVEEGAGKVADKLEGKQAQAAAEGRPGAVDPATDARVPARN
jgi:outer membrane lipoprotein-sorting protein